MTLASSSPNIQFTYQTSYALELCTIFKDIALFKYLLATAKYNFIL